MPGVPHRQQRSNGFAGETRLRVICLGICESSARNFKNIRLKMDFQVKGRTSPQRSHSHVNEVYANQKLSSLVTCRPEREQKKKKGLKLV